MITVVGYIDMLKPKSAIYRLTRTSTPLTDNTLLMGTNGNETNAISLEEVKQYLGSGSTENAIPLSEKGQPNGVATLDPNGKIPSSQLPVSGGNGGSGSGINVIEYDPSLYKQATPVVNTDWIPVKNTAVWNSETGVMGVGTPQPVSNKQYEFGNGATSYCSTEYAALKLDLATLFETRSITIDATLCKDAFGFMFMPKSANVSDVFKYQWFMPQQISSTKYNLAIFTTAQKVLDQYFFNFYSSGYSDNQEFVYSRDSTRDLAETSKPQGIYTLHRENALTYYIRQSGFASEQQFIDYLISLDIDLEQTMLQLELIKKQDVISLTLPNTNVGINFPSELYAENMDLYLIMTPYLGTHASAFNLDPTSQIQISYDLANINHPIPNSVVDGDIIHFTDKVNISGKIITKDSFIQLYANKAKYIPLSGTVR